MEWDRAFKIGALSLILSQTACSGIHNPFVKPPEQTPTPPTAVDVKPTAIPKPTVVVPTPTMTADEYDLWLIRSSTIYQKAKVELENQGKKVSLYELPPHSTAITTHPSGSKIRDNFLLEDVYIDTDKPFLQWDPNVGYPCRYLVGVGDTNNPKDQLWAFISDVFVKHNTPSLPGADYFSNYNESTQRSAWAVAQLGQNSYLRFQNVVPPYNMPPYSEVWSKPIPKEISWYTSLG